MKKSKFLYTATICMFSFLINANSQQPVKLCSINPNYLEYKGKPLLIISSSEHYGSVYNLGFNFNKHLETLSQENLNFAKVFMGLWMLPDDNVFGLSETPFCASKGNHITPWEKAEGKYNLQKWNPLFFERLHSMVSKAEELDIIIEITLFSSYYMQAAWETSPFYFKNNINDIDSVDYKRVHTMYNGNIFEYEEKLTRKLVRELNKYNNIFFEIQNEPWSDNPNLQSVVNIKNDSVYPNNWQKLVEVANDASISWQRNIAAIIVDEESHLSKKHLIAQCIGNFSPKILNPDPEISIFNFHYALPEAALINLKLNKIMSLDETGFMPHTDYNYRREAWQFILNGGGIYNNLDYSFIVTKEDGTHPIKETTPGWGGFEYRKQLQILKTFMQSFNFVLMKPMPELIDSKWSEHNQNAAILGETGKQYAVYFSYLQENEVIFRIPEGKYSYEWIKPVSGEVIEKGIIESVKGESIIKTPDRYTELALKIFSNN